MAYPTKIATCCHCGTTALLRVDRARHPLSCASCGAPLRNFKAIPVAQPKAPAVSHQPAPVHAKPRKVAPHQRKATRKGRWLRKFAEEAFDLVEEILD